MKKQPRKSKFAWLALFYLFKIINFQNASVSSNMLLTILSIVCSFVMSLKKYCWEKSGSASCKLKQFLQIRFCQSFSDRRIIGNYFYLFQMVELFLNILNPRLLQDCTYIPPLKIISIHSFRSFVIF